MLDRTDPTFPSRAAPIGSLFWWGDCGATGRSVINHGLIKHY